MLCKVDRAYQVLVNCHDSKFCFQNGELWVANVCLVYDYHGLSCCYFVSVDGMLRENVAIRHDRRNETA